jgi:molybdopterin converting factor small subunit
VTRVIMPSQLRGYTSGAKEVHAEGATLDAVLRDLDRRFPGIRFRVIDEQDRVRPHILIFVAGERTESIATPIGADAEVQIVGALSGG